MAACWQVSGAPRIGMLAYLGCLPMRHHRGVPLPAEHETFTARTPEQARMLLSYGYQVVLAVILEGEASAGEIARQSGVPLKAAHHRLTRLCDAGLAQVCGERPRGGRAVKLYRAAAPVFRVPFSLTAAEDVRELVASLFSPYLDAYFHQTGQRMMDAPGGLTIGRSPQGSLAVNFGQPSGLYQSFGTMGEHTLTPATRRELEARLRELQQWVAERTAAEKDDPDAQTCLLGLLFTPGGVE